MSAQLVVVAGPDLGRAFPLADGAPFLLGRGATSQSRLVDLAVSRLHCEVRVERGDVVVSDCQSGSGTFVNGQRIVIRSLQPGDIIKIGNTELRYEAAPPTPLVLAKRPEDRYSSAAALLTELESIK